MKNGVWDLICPPKISCAGGRGSIYTAGTILQKKGSERKVGTAIIFRMSAVIFALDQKRILQKKTKKIEEE